MNISWQVFVWTYCSAHLGKYDNWVIWQDCLALKRWPKKAHTKQLFPLAFPPVINRNACCFTFLPWFDVVNVLDSSRSDRCVTTSHFCFDSQFPSGIWCWTSFHMSLYRPYFFFVEEFVQVFCPPDDEVSLLSSRLERNGAISAHHTLLGSSYSPASASWVAGTTRTFYLYASEARLSARLSFPHALLTKHHHS